MKQVIKGTVFDIKRYAIHDGPGIRTTAFLKGCPIRCQWCANPESQNRSLEISHFLTDCISCGKCEQICPEKAIRLTEQGHFIDRASCTLCGRCINACPGDALEVVGRSVSPEALFDEMATDAPFWERSSGGVTLSGGEPLVQPEFVKAFLGICKENYIHTAIESCLYVSPHILDELGALTDYIIFDLKIMDEDKHRQFTGVSNKRILENAAALLTADQDVLVRMPVLPGINDHESEFLALGAFLHSHRQGVELELLPYHRLGLSKYVRLGRSSPMADIRVPSGETMEMASTILKQFNISVVTR